LGAQFSQGDFLPGSHVLSQLDGWHRQDRYTSDLSSAGKTAAPTMISTIAAEHLTRREFIPKTHATSYPYIPPLGQDGSGGHRKRTNWIDTASPILHCISFACPDTATMSPEAPVSLPIDFRHYLSLRLTQHTA
jgi:hypothetical protein